MSATPLLSIKNIEVIYEQVILAVKNISLEVAANSVVSLLGANGSGKSTTLKAISGLVHAQRGEIADGQIEYLGEVVNHSAPHRLVKQGLVQVLEGRHCFQHLSVEENLLTGGYIHRPSKAKLNAQLDNIYGYFPRLKKIRKSLAGYTSGGEQQMVAIGRALMSDPKLVLLDEPSMGLAPQIVEEIFEIIKNLRDNHGVSFLVAEQNAAVALRYTDYAYVLENGTISDEGTAQKINQSGKLLASYLGR